MAKEDMFTGPISKSNPAGTGATEQHNIEVSPGGDIEHDNGDIEALSRRQANLRQFPSLHGQPEVEVAGRSTDVEASATNTHRKVFRVFHDTYAFDPATFDHGPNFNATRQYMLDNGLRPTGEVTLVSTEDYDDRNVDLTYEVEAIPAVVAVDPAAAHVVVSQN